MSIEAIRHIGIVVGDMDRSVGFYRDLLGMEVWADFIEEGPFIQAVTDLPGAKVRMVKLKAADGVSIELLQYLSHPQSPPPSWQACDVGCNHLALRVSDIDSLYEELKANGVPFHTPPPTVSPDGYGKVTYCRDPEGVIVELVQIL